MTAARQSLGRQGEAVAERHLVGLGWRIVERNWRCRRGEIDLVARDGPCLVIVEVRARRGERFGTAVESVAKLKQQRLLHLGRTYVHERHWTGPWRIDVVGVQWSADPQPQITHVRHAVSG